MSAKNKIKEYRRRCYKCGQSPIDDPSTTLFRFPKPGRTNTIRCESWAKYVFPDGESFSPEFQEKLFKQHRMLCNRHFAKTSFKDYPLSDKKLHRCAVPEDMDKVPPNFNEEKNGYKKFAEPSKNFKADALPDEILLEFPGHINSNIEVTAENVSRWIHDNEALQAPVEAIDEPSYSELQSVSDVSLYEEDVQVVASELPDHETDVCTETTDVHECIVCNVCEKQIVGFRYVCVQCADWDHCAACEAGGAHAAHAVLRVHRQADIHRVIDAVREAIRCVCAEPESVTLHMDVTHEDGFGQVTMDEDNKDDIQLLELPSPVADGTETNPLDQDIPFYAEDCNKKLTDINHKETIPPTLTNPTKEMTVCRAFQRNEHNFNKILECPSEDNVPKEYDEIYRTDHVRIYSKRDCNELSGVNKVAQQHHRTRPIQQKQHIRTSPIQQQIRTSPMQQQHIRTNPIQQQQHIRTAPIQQQNSRTAPIQQQQNSRTAPIQHGADNIKESYISIKPHNLNLQQTKEIKQIPIEHIKKMKVVVLKKSPLRLKLDRTAFLQHKEKLLASGKVKLKRITPAEVDAAIKRQRLHQDTHSDDSS